MIDQPQMENTSCSPAGIPGNPIRDCSSVLLRAENSFSIAQARIDERRGRWATCARQRADNFSATIYLRKDPLLNCASSRMVSAVGPGGA